MLLLKALRAGGLHPTPRLFSKQDSQESLAAFHLALDTGVSLKESIPRG